MRIDRSTTSSGGTVHGPGTPRPPVDLSNVTVNVAPACRQIEGDGMARETVTENEPEWQPIEEDGKVVGSPPEAAVVALERGVVRPGLLVQPEVVALVTSNRTIMISAFRIDLTERRSSTLSRLVSSLGTAGCCAAQYGPGGRRGRGVDITHPDRAVRAGTARTSLSSTGVTDTKVVVPPPSSSPVWSREVWGRDGLYTCGAPVVMSVSVPTGSSPTPCPGRRSERRGRPWTRTSGRPPSPWAPLRR